MIFLGGAGEVFLGILEFCLYFSPSFECEPKRKQCKISSFSFFFFIYQKCIAF